MVVSHFTTSSDIEAGLLHGVISADARYVHLYRCIVCNNTSCVLYMYETVRQTFQLHTHRCILT
jgi:hypothetical protein